MWLTGFNGSVWCVQVQPSLDDFHEYSKQGLLGVEWILARKRFGIDGLKRLAFSLACSPSTPSLFSVIMPFMQNSRGYAGLSWPISSSLCAGHLCVQYCALQGGLGERTLFWTASAVSWHWLVSFLPKPLAEVSGAWCRLPSAGNWACSCRVFSRGPQFINNLLAFMWLTYKYLILPFCCLLIPIVFIKCIKAAEAVSREQVFGLATYLKDELLLSIKEEQKTHNPTLENPKARESHALFPLMYVYRDRSTGSPVFLIGISRISVVPVDILLFITFCCAKCLAYLKKLKKLKKLFKKTCEIKKLLWMAMDFQRLHEILLAWLTSCLPANRLVPSNEGWILTVKSDCVIKKNLFHFNTLCS